MKILNLLALSLLFLTSAFLSGRLTAEVPLILGHQGRISVDGVNPSGPVEFKFALTDGGVDQSRPASATAEVALTKIVAIDVTDEGEGYTSVPAVTIHDSAGMGFGAVATAVLEGSKVVAIVVEEGGADYIGDITVEIAPPAPLIIHENFWRNDGETIAGPPATPVIVELTQGLYHVELGNPEMMAAIPMAVFQNPAVFLRTWMRPPGESQFVELLPSQRITAVGYAVMAATVSDGAIATAQLAEGAVTASKIAHGAVQGVHLAEGAVSSLAIASHSIDMIHLRPGAVQTHAIDFEAVTGDRIADGAVGTLQLAPGAVTTPILADQSVTGEKIADGAVGFAQLGEGAVSGNRIADGAVQANHLAADVLAHMGAPGGQVGVPSGGLILAEKEDYRLIQSGYVRMGTVQMDGGWRRVDGGSAPAMRMDHTAVWTGEVWIVWGGVTPSGRTNTGGLFNPANNAWTPLSLEGAPDARSAHTAVWTGTEMIIWGGVLGDGTITNTGARYMPATNSWVPLPAGPTTRRGHSAVWTGEWMVIWGGTNGTEVLRTGSRYDPVSNSWAGTAVTNAPAVRRDHTAIWTGSEMIVWGGRNQAGDLKHITGGRYDPITNTWSATATFFAPTGRTGHTAVWTGSEMLVWGGSNEANVNLPTGGRYSPATNAWTDISMTGAPEARSGHTAVWGERKMLLWGGSGAAPYYANGYTYDPDADQWAAIADSAHAASGHAAAWTGTELLIYGGSPFQSQVQRYNVATDAWEAHDPGSAPLYRDLYETIWMGDRMFIWGGYYLDSAEDLIYPIVGGIFDPATGSWSPVSTVNAPLGRADFSMVWTGTHVIVWGGRRFNVGQEAYDYLATGGRYDPVMDEWLPISITDVPFERALHTAIWTGSEMMVWGGKSVPLIGSLQSGGRYNPTTDTWSPISNDGVPSRRHSHLVHWDGNALLIYGGIHNDTPLTDGAHYTPATDSWAPLPSNPLGNPTSQSGSAITTNQGLFLVRGNSSGTSLNFLQANDRWSFSRSSTSLSFSSQGFHASVGTSESQYLVFGRISAIGESEALGLEVDMEQRGLRPIPVIPSIPSVNSTGPVVFSGSEALKFVGVEQGQPGQIYGYSPSRTLFLYVRP